MSKGARRRRTMAAVLVLGAGLAASASAAHIAAGSPRWVLDPRTGCYVYDPDVQPADTAAWSGDCSDRRATGSGTAVFSAGDRFVESLSGTFAGGLATGAIRINWADGAHFEGHAVSGRIVRQDASTTPPTASVAPTGAPQSAERAQAQNSSEAPAAAPPAPRWLDAVSNHSFVSADGSVLVLTSGDGGLTQRIGAPDGASQLVYLKFLNGNQGTVALSAKAKNIDGVFHLDDSGMAVDYADGRSESLSAYSANALLSSLSGPREQQLCTVWYPEGHQFSAEERRAALDEYARRLGLGKGSSESCGSATTESASVAKPAPAAVKHKHADNGPAVPMLVATASAEPILVRNSDVHLIDAQAADSDMTRETISAASHAGQQVNKEVSAAACLSVAKENAGLGFHNSCAYDVQFAYCTAGAPDAACENQAVTISAAADAFAPVTVDAGFGAREFHFRWIECAGKSGDVTPHLVHSAPPAGQCTKPHPNGPILALKAPDIGTALTLPR
jgi:hypothetical protein